MIAKDPSLSAAPTDHGRLASRFAAGALTASALSNYAILSLLAGSVAWVFAGEGLFGVAALTGLVITPLVLAYLIAWRRSKAAAWFAAVWSLVSLLLTWGFFPTLAATIFALAMSIWAARALRSTAAPAEVVAATD